MLNVVALLGLVLPGALVIASFLGCRSEAPLALVELHGETMGTTYTVKLSALPEGVDSVALQAEIDRLLEKVNDRMSTWRPGSEISRFNRSDSLDWFPVSSATAEVCSAAKEVSEATEGAFDVTVGPLVNLWHFGPEEYAEKVPSDEVLRATAEYVGDDLWQVRLDPPALKKSHPKLYIDLSAIAKGYGVDVVADALDRHEVSGYMVEIGGEIRTRGSRGHDEPWSVAIESPTAGTRGIQTVLQLGDTALATSGDYRNFFEIEGRRFSHTVNPRTARPIEHQLASVSVLADDCMEADAWATAFMVLGSEAGYNWAVERDLAVLMIVRDGNRFVEKSTPRFETFRHSEQPPASQP